MWRGSAGLLAAVLALTGCKSTDTKSADKEPTGTSASRTKTKDSKDGKAPTWLDPVAKVPGSDTGVPKAASWTGDPKSPNFDPKAESQDAVGGKVVDTYGRPAKNIFIAIRGVNDPPGAAKLGIQTDNSGYFFTRGLKPGQSYNLTAEATQDGKQITGTVQTLVPNPVITIVLREDFGLPPSPKDTDGAAGAFPPPPTGSDSIPPAGLGPVSEPRTPRPTPTDASFAPGNGATNPVPSTIGTPPRPNGPAPSRPGAIPPPDDLSGPPKASHPENVADGPRNPFNPPAASIPGPPALPPTYPNPVAPPAGPDPKQSRVRPGANFTLVDTLERNWDFGTDKSGSFVLVEFVTSSCPNCKPAVPVLKDLQSRYAADGLQVVAVLCDDAPLKARAAAAAKYGRDNNVNYAVYVEPGANAGAVRDRLGVDRYPTAVLLDSTGAVLWKGHPLQRDNTLEAAVKKALGR